jgi:hypothetical protein
MKIRILIQFATNHMSHLKKSIRPTTANPEPVHGSPLDASNQYIGLNVIHPAEFDLDCEYVRYASNVGNATDLGLLKIDRNSSSQILRRRPPSFDVHPGRLNINLKIEPSADVACLFMHHILTKPFGLFDFPVFFFTAPNRS